MPETQMKELLPLNLQHFADTATEEGEETQETGEGAGEEQNNAPETFDKDYVEKLRKESAKYRTKAKELETSSKQQQQETMKKVFEALGIDPDPNKEFDKQLSDAQKKAQEAETRANERLIKAEVKALSAELGIVDADVAYQLMARDELKVNDGGDVEGAKEALESLLESKPFLRKETTPSNGGGDFSTGKTPSNLDDQIKEAEEKGDRSTAIRLKRQKAFGKK